MHRPFARTVPILAAWLLLVGGLVAAAPVAAQDAMGTQLQVLPISTQHWIGDNDLILALFDADSAPIASPDAPISLTLVDPQGVDHGRETQRGVVDRKQDRLGAGGGRDGADLLGAVDRRDQAREIGDHDRDPELGGGGDPALTGSVAGGERGACHGCSHTADGRPADTRVPAAAAKLSGEAVTRT